MCDKKVPASGNQSTTTATAATATNTILQLVKPAMLRGPQVCFLNHKEKQQSNTPDSMLPEVHTFPTLINQMFICFFHDII